MAVPPMLEHRRTHLSLTDSRGFPGPSGGVSRRGRCGLGTSAQAELRQDARHVMLDRLARDEEASGDFWVGEPFA